MIVSAQEFVRLRESPNRDEYLRAAHEEAALETWLEIIRDRPDMRFWVAQNKTVPIAVLALLAEDDDPRVRSMVAAKRKLPEQLQLSLTSDVDSGVRASLAHNAKATLKVLRVLSNDPDHEVRARALQRLAGG